MIYAVVKGLATYIPGIDIHKHKNLAGTTPADYYYSVWLRHLVKADEYGQNSNPASIIELGPGGTLGVGIAALLSGVQDYTAVDAVTHLNKEINLQIFETILENFKNKKPIPFSGRYQTINPKLEKYDFPDHILTPKRMKEALNPSRVEAIRNLLLSDLKANDDVVSINYFAPWVDASIISANSADMIISQAVLEHVDDLEEIYSCLSQWLKLNGYMSHQIDFKSHGTSSCWSGHWGYSSWVFSLMRGKRKYLINRQPLSAHLKLLERNKFECAAIDSVYSEPCLNREALSPEFRFLTNEDLQTSAAFLLSIYKGNLQ